MKFACLVLLLFVLAKVESRPQDKQDGSDKYSFQYFIEAEDPEENKVHMSHNEERTGRGVTGSYAVLLPDSRIMTVTYIADENGFQPIISYENI